ncbi:DNA protecting protein DprA [Microgenomates group bacterium RIFCSPLOWO2_01_FULL_46_13]|nr:MAG: DNA protecting protein DprA [Microgenomates group bacterium RIFCSPHIGHO2_01_FULL_45_11]OGV94918.1 MAG: DNA protecting protein DprA [Microgenomates group bacterium RIFCSPLOWO2_01_FULL_46_13]
MKKLSLLEKAHWVAVVETIGIGPKLFTLLLNHFGSARNIWQASADALHDCKVSPSVVNALLKHRQDIEPISHLDRLKALGITAVCLFEADYPANLKTIDRPPPVLFVKGNLTPGDTRALAVVGTRKPTSYGREVTEIFVKDLVNAGFTIVSGLAYGIDAIAHRTTLTAAGRTLAVLGGGPDNVYPADHRSLADDITNHGALISEFTPGVHPLRGNFPARNRLISGLSLGVLVIEGESKSGTKHTAHHALEQGRPIFAVPGPITSRLSDAPTDLIQKGAIAVRSVEDIVNHLKLSLTPPTATDLKPEFANDLEKIIYQTLALGEQHIDDLVRALGRTTAEVSTTLTLMELKGLIKSTGAGIWLKKTRV